MRKILLGVVLWLLLAAPAGAVTGGYGSTGGVYDSACECWAHWQLVALDYVPSVGLVGYYAVTFPTGESFVTGPIPL